MTRITRSSLLLLCAAALAVAPGLRANPLEPQNTDFAFESSRDLFFHGPVWLRNALWNSGATTLRRTSALSADSSAAETTSIYSYASDVGGLSNPYSPKFFTTASPYSVGGTSTAISPNATLAQKTFSATAGAWLTAANWSPSGVPTSSDDVLINAGTTTMTLTASNLTIQFITFTDTSSRILENSTGGTTASNLTLAATDASGNLINVNPASGTPTFTIRNGSTANLNVVLGASGNFNVGLAGATLLISSAISETGGARSITKTGPGTLTLSGANTYSGGTTVSGGRLLVNGGVFNSGTPALSTSGTGSGPVTVGGSGTILGGSGTINSGANAITVNSLATVAPGSASNTIGTLTMVTSALPGVTFGDSTIFLVDLNATTSDLLRISGTLDLSSLTNTIQFNQLATPTAASYTLVTATSILGTFDITSNIPSGYTLVQTATEIDLVMTPVPEASTWIGAALAVVAVGWTQRKRVRKKLTA